MLCTLHSHSHCRCWPFYSYSHTHVSKLSKHSLPVEVSIELFPLLFGSDRFDYNTMDQTAFSAFQSLFLLANCQESSLDLYNINYPTLNTHVKHLELPRGSSSSSEGAAVELEVQCTDTHLAGLEILNTLVMSAPTAVADKAADLMVTIMGAFAAPLNTYRMLPSSPDIRQEQLTKLTKDLGAFSEQLQDAYWDIHILLQDKERKEEGDDGEVPSGGSEKEVAGGEIPSVEEAHELFQELQRRADRFVRLLSLYVGRVLQVPKAKQHALRCRCADTIDVLSRTWHDNRAVADASSDPLLTALGANLPKISSPVQRAVAPCPNASAWQEMYSTADLPIVTIAKDEGLSHLSTLPGIPDGLHGYILSALEAPLLPETKQKVGFTVLCDCNCRHVMCSIFSCGQYS